MQNDLDRSKAFLGEVFRHKPAEHYLCLWDSETRKSRWVQDVAEITPLEQGRNWYYGLGTRSQPAATGRGTADGVEGIPGAWVDIDLKSAAHQKARLPAGLANIRHILDELDLEPSMIVHSGWGVHVYWLFDSYCLDTALAAQTVGTLQNVIRAICKDSGWELDATHDLSRILRLPGTWNLKTKDEPRFCEIKQAFENRYTPQQILAHVAISEYEPVAFVPKDPQPAVDVEVHDGLDLPSQKLFALLENDDKARASWENARTDLADTSPSGYDMSLAFLAARAGWDDQEIAALIYQHRKKHGHDTTKLRKKDYYIRTISKIRQRLQEENTASEADAIEEAEDETTNPHEMLKTLTGLAIQSVEQHGTEESEFVVIIAVEGVERRVRLGSAVNFTTQAAWIPALMEGLGKSFVSYKGVKAKIWKEKVLPSLAKLIEYKESGDSDLSEVIFDYLESAVDLVSQGVRDTAARADLIQDSKPFIDFNGVYIHGPSFQRYIHLVTGKRVSRNVLSRLLRGAGFEARIAEGLGRTSEDEMQRIQRRYFVKGSALGANHEG